MPRLTTVIADPTQDQRRPAGLHSGLLRRSADRIANVIDHYPLYAFTVFIVLYVLATLAHAMKRFWYDELFTYYISRLPDLASYSAVAKAGVDPSPPLIYLMTSLAHRLFGFSPVATRVPEMLGFLAMCVCIFVFVRRRCGFLYGFAAMGFPLVTTAYCYAFEARPSALVLGFCGIATVCWQSAAEKRRRGWPLIALSLSLAGALMSHCYAILIFIPFGIAELVRLAQRRRPDWLIWASIVTPLTCVLLYIPMLRSVQHTSFHSASCEPSLSLTPRFYEFLLNQPNRTFDRFNWQQAVWPTTIALIIIALAKRPSTEDSRPAILTTVPLHEIVCLASFASLPIFGRLLAVTVTHTFTEHYALPAVIGFSGLFAILAFKATAGNRRVAAAMAILFPAWFIMTFAMWFASLSQPRVYDLPSLQLSSLPASMPIVVSNPMMFLESCHQERPDVASRLRYLKDREWALRYTGSDRFSVGDFGKRWIPIKGQVAEYNDFVAKNKHFFVWGPFTYPEDWLMRRLIASGVTLVVKGQYWGAYGLDGSTILLEVTIP